MSGVILDFRRDGAPADRSVAARMLGRLSHRGPDGHRLVVEGPVGLGCQQFWTTPEEVGEAQPVAAGERLVAFDGRLDNRAELLRDLEPCDGEAPSSDAEIVLAAYARWGDSCFERFLGPFAVVVWNPSTQSVTAARDGLGDRTLFFNISPARLVMASEEHALLAHPEISSRLDERRVAYHFAIQVPADGSTFFADITELRPGEVLTVDSVTVRTGRCWHPSPLPEVARLADGECVERYLEVFSAAVRCRLRSTTPPAVIMSGGLDSTSIAAVGARELAAAGTPYSMRAVSWVFDEFADCDERLFIEQAVVGSSLDAWQVVGDDAWPLADLGILSRNPSTPEQNPYRELKERAHRRAAQVGSRVALSGASADVFSSGTESWFVDLVLAGRWLEAGRSLAADVRSRGFRDGLRRAGFSAPLRLIRRRLRRSGGDPTPWLTGAARSLVDSGARVDAAWRLFPRTAQCAAVLGDRAARSVSVEIFDACQAGVELRHPYRDRRLTELMLSVAAHQLYRHGRFKHLAREAAHDFLPAPIIEKTVPTVLTPLFRSGVFVRELDLVERILHTGDAVWRRYVDGRIIEDILRHGPRRPHDEVLLWHCVGIESWIQRHNWLGDSRQRSSGSVFLEESAA